MIWAQVLPGPDSDSCVSGLLGCYGRKSGLRRNDENFSLTPSPDPSDSPSWIIRLNWLSQGRPQTRSGLQPSLNKCKLIGNLFKSGDFTSKSFSDSSFFFFFLSCTTLLAGYLFPDQGSTPCLLRGWKHVVPTTALPENPDSSLKIKILAILDLKCEGVQGYELHSLSGVAGAVKWVYRNRRRLTVTLPEA